MASIAKKIIVRYTDPTTDSRCKSTVPGAIKSTEESSKFYGKGIPGEPPSREFPLFADRRSSEAELARLCREGERKLAGLHTDEHQVYTASVADLVAEWLRDVSARGASPQYVQSCRTRVSRVLEGIGAKTLADVKPERVRALLAGLLAPQPVPALPDSLGEDVSVSAVATLCDCSRSAVIRQCRLLSVQVIRRGREKTIPRQSAMAVCGQLCMGTSPCTVNYHLREMKSWLKWLVANDRIAKSPLAGLKRIDQSQDVRSERRSLSRDEIDRLLWHTFRSEEVYGGLSGQQRSLLYTFSLATAHRAGVIATVTPSSLHLDDAIPTVEVRRGRGRKGTVERQPIPSALVEPLRQLVKDLPYHEPLWGSGWLKQASEMLQADCVMAEIPVRTEGPNGPLFVVFHSLRHTAALLGSQAGLSLKEQMDRLGHKTPAMTLSRYGKANLAERASAAEKVPVMLASETPELLCDPLADLPPGEIRRLALIGLLAEAERRLK